MVIGKQRKNSKLGPQTTTGEWEQDTFYLHHGGISNPGLELKPQLKAVKRFITSHPEEIIILHVRGLCRELGVGDCEKMNLSEKYKLSKLFKEIFGATHIASNQEIINQNIYYLQSNKKIVINWEGWGNDGFSDVISFNYVEVPHMWTIQAKLDKMYPAHTKNLKKDSGIAKLKVMHPVIWGVNVWATTKDFAHPIAMKWIKEWQDDPETKNGLNIIAFDFFEESELVKTLIDSNKKEVDIRRTRRKVQVYPHDQPVPAGIRDKGYPDMPRFYVDINNDSTADFGRFVGSREKARLSFALKNQNGTWEQYGYSTIEGLDRGYFNQSGIPDPWLEDVNGDGILDYCRYVGSSSNPSPAACYGMTNGFSTKPEHQYIRFNKELNAPPRPAEILFTKGKAVYLKNMATNRILTSTGDYLTGAEGAEGGWSKSPLVFGADDNYLDLTTRKERGKWQLIPKPDTEDIYFLQNYATKRYLLATGEKTTENSKAEIAWLKKTAHFFGTLKYDVKCPQCPTIVGADKNYDDRALWRITRSEENTAAYSIQNVKTGRFLFSTGIKVKNREFGSLQIPKAQGSPDHKRVVGSVANMDNRARWYIHGFRE